MRHKIGKPGASIGKQRIGMLEMNEYLFLVIGPEFPHFFNGHAKYLGDHQGFVNSRYFFTVFNAFERGRMHVIAGGFP